MKSINESYQERLKCLDIKELYSDCELNYYSSDDIESKINIIIRSIVLLEHVKFALNFNDEQFEKLLNDIDASHILTRFYKHFMFYVNKPLFAWDELFSEVKKEENKN